MDFLGDLSITQIILTILGLLATAWGLFRKILSKAFTAVDEIEDVVKSGAKVLSEVTDVLNAVTAAGKPEEDGSIKFTADEWQKIKDETMQVKQAADNFLFELKDAWAVLKGIFKKTKK